MTVGELFHRLAAYDGNRTVLTLPVEIHGRGPTYGKVMVVEPAFVDDADGEGQPVVLLRVEPRSEDL